MTRRHGASGVVLAVCGLAVEARIAAGRGVRTIAGGGVSTSLTVVIERHIEVGDVAGIVSFGIAGSLLASLGAGALIVADEVIDVSVDVPRRYRTDGEWARVLRDRLGTSIEGSTEATIAGGDSIVADPSHKAALRSFSGAAAVDMESHVAARVAAAHGIRFAALRAVADPLARSLPPAARVAMHDGGGIDLAAVLRSVLRSPGQIPQLARIGVDTRKALSALGRGRRLLGDGLGHPDLDQLLLDVV